MYRLTPDWICQDAIADHVEYLLLGSGSRQLSATFAITFAVSGTLQVLPVRPADMKCSAASTAFDKSGQQMSAAISLRRTA